MKKGYSGVMNISGVMGPYNGTYGTYVGPYDGYNGPYGPAT
jgi:hypothetical protein